MSRIIRCEKCNQKMGEIRDAALRKDIVYFCQRCHANNKAVIAAASHLSKSNQSPDWLKSIFGGL